MRNVLIVGLVLLAAFLPLAAVPLGTFVLERRVFVVEVVSSYVSAGAPPVALLALNFLRAPPSR
jgi:hypothetical protein